VALDGARAVAEDEASDDGVEVLAKAGDEGMQGGQVIRLDAGDLLVEAFALAVVHQLSERADMVGGSVERAAAGQDRFELLGLVVGETVGVAGQPAGHVPDGRCFAGRVVREVLAALGHVLLHDALAAV
jgi:hypothetical protein